jgi:hypothetical protein
MNDATAFMDGARDALQPLRVGKAHMTACPPVK